MTRASRFLCRGCAEPAARGASEAAGRRLLTAPRRGAGPNPAPVEALL